MIRSVLLCTVLSVSVLQQAESQIFRTPLLHDHEFYRCSDKRHPIDYKTGSPPFTVGVMGSPRKSHLLSDSVVRYFRVQDDGNGQVLIARKTNESETGSISPEAAAMTIRLETMTAAMRNSRRLSVPMADIFGRGGAHFWVHGCGPGTVEPPLGCRTVTETTRYDFSEAFRIEDERIVLNETRYAVRFMVMGTRDAHLRIRESMSPESRTYYEIDINFVGKIAIQKLSEYMDVARCSNCMSPSEFRLFTVVYNDTRLQVYEGKTLDKPHLDIKLEYGFKPTFLSFASMGSAGTVTWLHACQGYAAHDVHEATESPSLEPRKPLEPLEPLEPLPGMLPALMVPRIGAPAIYDKSMLPGCRVVNTFKYRFDGYFSISEEGVVSGSTSKLSFFVLARKDVHVQLVSSIPPSQDYIYEIDIGFYNHTNLDRGKEAKVVSEQQYDLLSEKELRGFVITHDAKTGWLQLSTFAPVERVLFRWRDPQPFPLRYFSICSGSNAGNDTTWVLGCPAFRGAPSAPAPAPVPGTIPDTEGHNKTDGCSRPLHTYSYSHSQYLSVAREGSVSGSKRRIRLFLRAAGSGHIRLEAALPPAVDALLEVDLSHEGNSSIDFMGKRAASKTTPGLLSKDQLRGFWVLQDMDSRTVKVGVDGEPEDRALLSWTAPPGLKFPEVRFFSLATSRSVGNGTWIYGCDDSPTTQPKEDTSGSDAKAEESDDVFLTSEEVNGLVDELEETEETAGVTTMPSLTGQASQALHFHYRINSRAAPRGTRFGIHLHIAKLYLDDFTGMVVLKGHLVAVWNDSSIGWDPNEFDNIQDASNVKLGWTWTPDITVSNGHVETEGLVHLHHSGGIRWEAALSAQTHCAMQARAWPRDTHSCVINVSLASGEGHTLYLMGDHGSNSSQRSWVDRSASAPLWHIQALAMKLGLGDGEGDVTTFGTEPSTFRVHVSLQRKAPVMRTLLLSPFVVLAALCQLAYWVREPLPRDKVVLGCGSLLLLVFSFLILEAACPPALIGMPLIVEVYCWCLSVVTLAVIVSAVMTALARDKPDTSPPLVLCRIVSVPLVRWLLLLSTEQVTQQYSGDKLGSDGVDYKKPKNQIYLRFDQSSSQQCRCNEKGCSKQAAMEAQYYWILLALASERILSIMCFMFLLIAVIVV